MDYRPFIQTIEILVTRAKIDQIPADTTLILTSLKGIITKYRKLASFQQPEPVRREITAIENNLIQLEVMLRETPFKDYWVQRITAFLSNLKMDPLKMPPP